jgi:iron only hydrogenase large subunit-like protein
MPIKDKDGLQVPEEFDPVKITLADCLACSGCVTTAETLLVTQQSKEEILSVLSSQSAPRRVVVSVSEQSLASLSVALNLPLDEAASCISGFCKTVLGAIYVVDLRWAQEIALEATVREYFYRVENAPQRLPIIVSSCPGWVCYCEKRHPELIPLLSEVPSAQAMAGWYMKEVLGQSFWKEQGDASVYHVSVQPCFDRKLEAVRPELSATGRSSDGTATTIDFQSQKSKESIKDTDCVLSTQELLNWMSEVDPGMPWRAAWDSLPEPLRDQAMECPALGFEGSGGYHQRVLLEIARRSGVAATTGGTPSTHAIGLEQLRYQSKRNPNHQIVTIDPSLGEWTKKIEFCVAYGFQQIQNVIRSLKRGAISSCQFIELMACPDGCLNGGGQIRTKQQRRTLEAVQNRFGERQRALAQSPVHSAGQLDLEGSTQRLSSLSEPPRGKPRREATGEPEEQNEPSKLASFPAPPSQTVAFRGSFLFSSQSFRDAYQQGQGSNLHPLQLRFVDRSKLLAESDNPSQQLINSLKW